MHNFSRQVDDVGHLILILQGFLDFLIVRIEGFNREIHQLDRLIDISLLNFFPEVQLGQSLRHPDDSEQRSWSDVHVANFVEVSVALGLSLLNVFRDDVLVERWRDDGLEGCGVGDVGSQELFVVSFQLKGRVFGRTTGLMH